MSRPIVIIGVDPGQRGAIASCSLDRPSEVHVRFAEGPSGYYFDSQLELPAVVSALTVAAENAGWKKGDFIVVVLEALGKWRTRFEGVDSTESATRAHQAWRDAVKVLGWDLFERQTQWLDRHAGLKRTTKGGRNRKAEVALFIDHLASEGVVDISLDELIPPGRRTFSDGAADAILFMRAGCRALAGRGS